MLPHRLIVDFTDFWSSPPTHRYTDNINNGIITPITKPFYNCQHWQQQQQQQQPELFIKGRSEARNGHYSMCSFNLSFQSPSCSAVVLADPAAAAVRHNDTCQREKDNDCCRLFCSDCLKRLSHSFLSLIISKLDRSQIPLLPTNTIDVVFHRPPASLINLPRARAIQAALLQTTH